MTAQVSPARNASRMMRTQMRRILVDKCPLNRTGVGVGGFGGAAETQLASSSSDMMRSLISGHVLCWSVLLLNLPWSHKPSRDSGFGS